MEIYVHRPGEERIELRVVEETVTVEEAVKLRNGENVWLEDTEEIVDVRITVTEAGIAHRGHVHVNKCHRAVVTVNFNGQTKTRDFPVATRIEHVFRWATGKDGFPLADADALEHTLQVCNTTTQPDGDDHVGSFVSDQCTVCFDLVPKHRIEG